MKIKILIIMLLITFFTGNNISAKGIKQNTINKNSTYKVIANDEDLNIDISNVEIINRKVKLDKDYNSYAIITMDVINTGLEEIELSNINTYAYQNRKLLPTFIKSEKDECLGFVGVLSSGENKVIRICVGLEKNSSKIKLVFEDSRNHSNNILKKEIDI